MNTGMSYQGFGYVVDSCPLSKEETTEAASRLNCSVDENGRSQYVCVPNQYLTAVVEFCYTKTIVGIYQKGNCLNAIGNGFLHQISCKSFTMGCPTEHFRSNDLYKYPACHRLNTEERCFVADPSCDAKRSKMVDTSTSIFGFLNTTIDYNSNSTTTKTDVHDENGNLGAIIGVIVSLLLLIGILVIVRFIWRRRQNERRKRGNREELESLFLEAPSHDTGRRNLNDIEDYSVLQTSFSGRRNVNDIEDYSLWQTSISERENENDALLSKVPVHDTSTQILQRCQDQEQQGNGKSITLGLKDMFLGEYSVWKTSISEQFYTLTDDEVSVLFCFLCSDSCLPDFTDTEWLDVLDVIRRDVYMKMNSVTSDIAQQTLNMIKSYDFLWVDKTRVNLTGDAQDEIMYHVSNHGAFNTLAVFYLSSFITTQRYLRSQKYKRKPGEKCVTVYSLYNDHRVSCDSLLIYRLQLDILTHVTLEDTEIPDKAAEMLNVPRRIILGNKQKRRDFQEKLKQTGEIMEYRRRSNDSVQHVKCLRECKGYAMPDIMRSCIGLHAHWDIYIINNKTTRKPSQYHTYPDDVRCLLYCCLLVDECIFNYSKQSHKTLLNELRKRYFTDLPLDAVNLKNVSEGILEEEESKLKFKSYDIQHDVMYAFVTECLVETSDMEFFLLTASRDLISEYCRSWGYGRSEGERCLYVPVRMFDLFIDKLQLDIIKHCTMSDRNIHSLISKELGIPWEVLQWDKEARERYVEYAKRGTQTVHHARGMIVGCAGAGKTTLLKRLMGCTEEELRNVESTVGLEVHEEIFQIDEETKKLIALPVLNDDERKGLNTSQNTKTLSFFDFGGQCAYYACHQIYLTRRAFYIVVVDASKCLDQVVDEAVCHQLGSAFSCWTYGEYFVFWLKSIHTYCNAENEEAQKPVVLIVATHWEQKIEQYEDKDVFLEILQKQLPRKSHLSQYINSENCFCIQFSVPLDDLERCIANIACYLRWKERIPKEWVMFEYYLNQKKTQKILKTSSIEFKAKENIDVPEKSLNDYGTLKKHDMLRFYHDAGKVLYFNEDELRRFVIIDVQWFIDAFKNIITDKLHLKGMKCTLEDWEEYYYTGNLRYHILDRIWEDTFGYGVLKYENVLLYFMQRLGLVAIGKLSYYVPCMNRKEMEEEIQDVILQSKSKSSVLVYRFDILPYFFFFRLVVACMQEEGWNVLKGGGISHLYRNAALFFIKQYNIILSVTADSIQLQVLHAVSGQSLDVEETRQIQITVDELLAAIIGTFHKKLMFVKGIRCQEDKEKPFAMEIHNHFLEDRNIPREDKTDQVCPLHRMKDFHFINTYELRKYWEF